MVITGQPLLIHPSSTCPSLKFLGLAHSPSNKQAEKGGNEDEYGGGMRDWDTRIGKEEERESEKD